MIGTINKLNSDSISYIILFDTNEKYNNKIRKLQENTSTTKFKDIMRNFNIVTLETFNKGNPFQEYVNN